MLTPENYYRKIKSHFEENGDPETAQGQIKYMRDKFEFYGLKATDWVPYSKILFEEEGILTGDDLKRFARRCMEDEYREINYMGLQMVEKAIKPRKNGWTPPPDFIFFYEELATRNPWWDSIDWIKNFVALHFKIYPKTRNPTIEKWMDSDNFWLQRICLIFQLTLKNETDSELLFNLINRLKGSDEFFIQKAAGWALRQYSKYNPEAVIDFVSNTEELPKLTIREGLKFLKKNGQI